MLELGWIQHPLEPCLFLSARVAIDADSEFEIYEDSTTQNRMIIDGMVGLHVDDFLGCGEGIACEEDLKTIMHSGASEYCFAYRLGCLNERFKFGS